MKRISCRITAIYEALFEDFCMWGQGNPGVFERDLDRIKTLIETRGVRSVFLDFPAYGKLLDYAISRGVLHHGLFPLLGKEQDGLPVFLHHLFERVFDSNGILLPNADTAAVSSLRQVLRVFQKVAIPCGEDFVKETVNGFFVTDRSLRPISDSWLHGTFNGTCSFSEALLGDSQGDLFLGSTGYVPTNLVTTFQRVCDMVVSMFPAFHPDSIIGNHGPGAVADGRLARDDKYLFKIWSNQLGRVFQRCNHGSANFRLFLECDEANMLELEDQREHPSKLIAVPKNQEKPRLIASEPTANQFIQGGMRKYLRSCIKQTALTRSINIVDQSISRGRALEVSKNPSLATVDLKDASDRLSCWTVERALRRRPEILEALASCRSAALEDPTYTGQRIQLRKYAPQGNATVFPLQSIIYALAAIAATAWSSTGGRLRKGSDLRKAIVKAAKQVTVFGDDIILPTQALPALSSLLELCQLKINGAKSHFSGNFAESCGMDAFRGTDVTPAYIGHIEDTESPETVKSCIDVSNNFYRKGLFHTSRVVESWVPSDLLRHIPIARDPDGLPIALQTYSSGIATSRKRFNKNLFRTELFVLVLETRVKRIKRDSWESLLQYFTENPSPDDFWESGVQSEVRQRLRRKWVSLY